MSFGPARSLTEAIQGSGVMLSSLERALIRPKELRNPKVFAVSLLPPGQFPVLSSKTLLEKLITIYTHTAPVCKIPGISVVAGCTSFPVPKPSDISAFLTRGKKRKKQILGHT